MRFATLADQAAVEAICNDPLIRVWTAFEGAPLCNAEKYLTHPSFVVIGDEGCFLAQSYGEARYCVHTNLLPHCRGAQAMRVAREALRMAFVQTDCRELVTMVPADNPQADWMARAMGFRLVFKRVSLWPGLLGRHDVRFFSMSIDDWISTGACSDSGRWFHDKLQAHELVEHPDDPIHHAYVGAAVEMIRVGNVDKGLAVYNRSARFAFYEPVRVVSNDPLRIDIRDCVLRVEGGDFNVEACHA